MSEELPPGFNAPSNVSIREHIEVLIAANDLRYKERFESQQKAAEIAFNAQATAMQTAFLASKSAVDQAMASAEKAVAAALAAADRAVTKSEDAANARFASINEFRGTLSDQQRTLMPRAEAELLFKTLSDKIELLTVEQKRMEGSKNGVILTISIIVALISSIVAIMLAFMHR
jgi:hypothetical protein